MAAAVVTELVILHYQNGGERSGEADDAATDSSRCRRRFSISYDDDDDDDDGDHMAETFVPVFPRSNIHENTLSPDREMLTEHIISMLKHHYATRNHRCGVEFETFSKSISFYGLLSVFVTRRWDDDDDASDEH